MLYIMSISKKQYLDKYIGKVDKQMSSKSLDKYNKVKVMTGIYKLQKKGSTTRYLVGKKIHYKKTGLDMKRRNKKQQWEQKGAGLFGKRMKKTNKKEKLYFSMLEEIENGEVPDPPFEKSEKEIIEFLSKRVNNDPEITKKIKNIYKFITTGGEPFRSSDFLKLSIATISKEHFKKYSGV